MKRFAWILGLLCLLLCSCSNSEKASAPQESSKVDFSLDSLSGMLRVKSAHSEVVLGTDAASMGIVFSLSTPSTSKTMALIWVKS